MIYFCKAWASLFCESIVTKNIAKFIKLIQISSSLIEELLNKLLGLKVRNRITNQSNSVLLKQVSYVSMLTSLLL